MYNPTNITNGCMIEKGQRFGLALVVVWCCFGVVLVSIWSQFGLGMDLNSVIFDHVDMHVTC